MPDKKPDATRHLPPRRTDPLPSHFIPSSPWFTIEEAAARARMAPRALKAHLTRLKRAGESPTVGGKGSRMIHGKVLEELISRGFRPRSAPQPIARPEPGEARRDNDARIHVVLALSPFGRGPAQDRRAALDRRGKPDGGPPRQHLPAPMAIMLPQAVMDGAQHIHHEQGSGDSIC